MTIQEFITQYTGKGINYGVGTQCVALMRQYLQDVLGLDPYVLPAQRWAKQIYLNFYRGDLFTKISNTPFNVPQEGDLVFWGFYPGVTGWPGHVGIFVGGNENGFQSFDQNYPTGSLCHLQSHTYKGVLGWLRKR